MKGSVPVSAESGVLNLQLVFSALPRASYLLTPSLLMFLMPWIISICGWWGHHVTKAFFLTNSAHHVTIPWQWLGVPHGRKNQKYPIVHYYLSISHKIHPKSVCVSLTTGYRAVMAVSTMGQWCDSPMNLGVHYLQTKSYYSNGNRHQMNHSSTSGFSDWRAWKKTINSVKSHWVPWKLSDPHCIESHETLLNPYTNPI